MRGSFVFLVLRDFFPKWAVDEGLLKDKSIVTRFFRQVERFNYRSSNVIGVQSSANLDVFKAIYSDYVDLKVLMNWSEQTPYEFEDGDDPHSLRKKLNIPLHKVIIFMVAVAVLKICLTLYDLPEGCVPTRTRTFFW